MPDQTPPQRGPRRYPHGSGDRNTMRSSKTEDMPVFAPEGRQRKPETDSASGDGSDGTKSR